MSADPFFVCKVCGVAVDLHPDGGPGVCQAHCEDHEFEGDSQGYWPACIHCGLSAPDDYYDGCGIDE